MELILRRIISSSINAILIVFFLTIISLFFALCFWFVPISHAVSTSTYYALFAFVYSVTGGLGLLIIPRLGSIIAGIKLINVEDKRNRNLSIILRILIFYLAPSIVFFIIKYPFLLFNLHDKQIMLMLIFPLGFISFFSLLFVPISIVVSKGYMGIHDIISGIAVIKKYENNYDKIDTKKLVNKSVIINICLSLILSFSLLKLLFVFDLQNDLFHIATCKNKNGTFFEIVEQIDSIMPNTPINIRNYSMLGGVKWWVDLTSDTQKMKTFNKSIGLKGLDVLDLLAYGISIQKQNGNVELVSINKDRERIVDEGVHILKANFFVCPGAFYFAEIKSIILSAFHNSLIRIADENGIKIINLKFLRIVKVGFVTIGFFDEVYFTNDGSKWRDKRSIRLPVILTFDNRIPSKGVYITAEDLDY